MFFTWVIGLAFLQRNYSVAFGADVIGGLFLFYLSFTQCCERWTLKNWLNKKLGGVAQAVVHSDDLSAVFYRLIQLQLCVIYMYTGFEKLKGMSWWDGTALPWQNPSPNMRSLTAATLYPGIGLLEFAISVGRGTDSPFEILGAPYVKADSLARELSALQLPGIRFSPAHFKPKSSVFKDQPCGGVKLLITDRAVLRPTSVGFAIGHTLHRLYGEKFDLKQFNRLMQDAKAISDLREGKPWTLTTQRWHRGVDDFLTRRKPFLLYRE
jgi:uncharacterized protein YbbC (DUF1343 family)